MADPHPASPQEHGLPCLAPGLVVFVGVAAMAWASILIRWASAPPLVVGAGRLALATLFLLPWAGPAVRAEWRGLGRLGSAQLALSGVALGVHFGAWIASLHLTTVGSSVVLVTTTPLFVALASGVVLHERVSRAMIAGVLLAMVGAAAIGVGDVQAALRGALAGDLLALLGALMAAVYVLLGRVLRRQLSLLAYVLPTYGLAAMVLVAASMVARQPLWGYSPRVYLLLALLALGPQLVGHTAVNWALRYVSPTYVTVAILGEPLGATLLALVFLGERPSYVLIAGGTALLVGIVLASSSERQGSAA